MQSSLTAASAQSLALLLAELTEDALLNSGKQYTLDKSSISLQKLDALVDSLQNRIPPESVRLVVQQLQIVSQASFGVLCWRFANILGSIALNSELVDSTFVSSSPAGLVSLDMSELAVGDDFFFALASSNAAETLEIFVIGKNYITDASAGLWRRFGSLRYLKMDGNRYLTSTSFEILGSTEMIIATLDLGTITAKTDAIVRIFLEKILGGGSFPSLEEFKFDYVQCDIAFGPVEILQLLGSILAEQPIRPRLKFLPGIDKYYSNPLHQEIRRIHPHLQFKSHTSVVANQTRPLVSCLKGTTNLVLDHSAIYDFPELLSIAKDQMPSLNRLETMFGLTDTKCLEQLQSLAQLCISAHDARCIQFEHGMPALEVLNIKLEGYSHLPADSALLESILSSIRTNFPNLTSLKLDVASHFSPSQVESVAMAFPKMKYLALPCSHPFPPANYMDELDSFVLNHEKLESFSTSELPGALPGKLPALVKFSGYVHNVAPALASLSPQNQPSLIDVSLVESPEYRIAQSDTRFDGAWNALVQFHQTLSTLMIQISLNDEHLIKLTSLKHLQSLTLNACKMSSTTASAVLSSLPWLSRLTMVGVSGLNDSRWLKHSLLQYLSISNYSAVDEPELFLSSDNCPRLYSITLEHFRYPNAIICQGMQNLRELIIRNPSIGSNISVTNCPLLCSMELSSVIVNGVRINEVPKLFKLLLLQCYLLEALNNQAVEMDLPVSTQLFVHASYSEGGIWDWRERLTAKKK